MAKVELLPLEGKYYATIIEYGDIIIELGGGSGRASNREIQDSGFTILDYENNVVDPQSEWGETVKEVVNDPGGHYEKQDTYEAALKILEALNG